MTEVGSFERARWEGQIEARMADAERRLDAINGSIIVHAKATNDLALKVGSLATKVAIGAGLGSLFSGAVLAAGIAYFQ